MQSSRTEGEVIQQMVMYGKVLETQSTVRMRYAAEELASHAYGMAIRQQCCEKKLPHVPELQGMAIWWRLREVVGENQTKQKRGETTEEGRYIHIVKTKRNGENAWLAHPQRNEQTHTSR